MKKVLILGLFLVAAVATIAAISAASEGVTIEGINFTIPDGYKAVEKQLEANETDDDTGAKEREDIEGTPVDKKITNEYKNSAGDEIEIEVGIQDGKDIDKINPSGYGAKKIGDKDGFFINGTEDGKTKCSFLYIQDLYQNSFLQYQHSFLLTVLYECR